MRRQPFIVSLLSFAAAAGVLWAIAWFGLALIFLIAQVGAEPDQRNWGAALAGCAICGVIASLGILIASGAGALERRLEATRRRPRGFDVIPAAEIASDERRPSPAEPTQRGSNATADGTMR
jgi:hypothetical protein